MNLSYLLTLASATLTITAPTHSNSTQLQLNNTEHLNNLSKKQAAGYSNCDAINFSGIENHKSGNSIIATCKTDVECQAADILANYCPSLTVSTAIPTASTSTPTSSASITSMSITPVPTPTSVSTADCTNIDAAAKLLGLEKNGKTIICKTTEQCVQADLYKALCSELAVSTAIPTPTPSATSSANKANIALPAAALAGVIGLAAAVIL